MDTHCTNSEDMHIIDTDNMCCICAYKSAELFFPGSTVSKLPFKVLGPRDLSQ